MHIEIDDRYYRQQLISKINLIGLNIAYTTNIMRPLIISLLTTGSFLWSVVWSDGRNTETQDFDHRAEAEKFFDSLVSKNPGAICFVDGKVR